MLNEILEWVGHFTPAFFIMRDSGINYFDRFGFAAWLDAKTEIRLAQMREGR